MKTPYSELIYKRTYSRWLPELGRRENWEETVTRYHNFFEPRVPTSLMGEFVCATTAVLNKQVMPSMRALWTAGEALANENIAGYNCAYTVIDTARSFSEILYILMCGTGVGFSVEQQYVKQLPVVPECLKHAAHSDPIVVGDSKLGWAVALEYVIHELYAGFIPVVDYSQVRPKGARLKTFGGRASGHEPLKHLIDFVISVFQNAKGRRLSSVECYDICCTIANCVVVGGVRRSATISLSDLEDNKMRHAKDGEFWLLHPHRSLSNNSAVYSEKPDMQSFMAEWSALMASGSGERGIVNRDGLKLQAASIGRDPDVNYGVNPCGEIILKPREFCNLTEVVVRPFDTPEILKDKVRHATVLGMLQSTLTDFGFLSDTWKKNVEEERLLGVSLTGVADCPLLDHFANPADVARLLSELRLEAHTTARRWAVALGIPVPKAITCVKPSGTVSQLVGCSSGLHPRYSQYYLRRVRINATDPIAQYLKDVGVPWQPEVGHTVEDHATAVFEFPLKAANSLTGTPVLKKDVSAIQQLNHWKLFKNYWCDHNPSVTVYVKEHEWLEVGAWVYKNWNSVGGLSFLPDDGGVYQLQPYEEISKEQYQTLIATFPYLDFSELSQYEKEDKTEGSQEYACVGGVCEL